MFTPYSFSLPSLQINHRNLSNLSARRKRDRDSDKDPSEMNSWYDAVDADATPDDVFWGEMERQRSVNMPPSDIDNPPVDPLSAISSLNSNGGGGGSGGGSGSGGGGKEQNQQNQQLQSQTPVWKDSNTETGGVAAGMNTEKVLGSYESFMVSDNWLNEDYKKELEEDEDAMLKEQIEEWNRQSDNESNDDSGFNAATSEEPWDFWSEDGTVVERDMIDMDKGASITSAYIWSRPALNQ
jgi:hypothetical protein